jgi:short-subunit dehydrogenase
MGGMSTFIHADLSSKESIGEAISTINSTFKSIDILINNAGIVTGKLFIDHSIDEIENTIGVNLVACMLLSKGLLPGMRLKGSGHVVNIASSAGMAAHPKLSVYVASKWGVIGWSESLRLELEEEKTGIRVTTVTPYYIDTGMFSGVKSPIIPLLKPEKVSKKIIVAIEKNRIFSRMPWLVYAIPFVKGIMPQRWFDFILGKVYRVYSSMDSFKG